MSISNRQVINKAAITTSSLSGGGILSPEQANKFLKQSFESNELGKHIRRVTKKAKSGEIDKIGIGQRLLRKKVEGVDDGYRAGLTSGKLEYSTTAVRVPWEITEETLRENIEGQSLSAILTNFLTTQVGLDSMDLALNGDEDNASIAAFDATKAYAIGDKVIYDSKLYKFTAAHTAGAWSASEAEAIGTQGDVDFLKINNGWIKQLKNGSHVVDMSSARTLKIEMFYKAVQAIPNKYNNGKLRWLMSPHMAQNWEVFLLNKCLENGSTAPESLLKSPAGIGVIACPTLSDDSIILTDPQNLIVVNTYDMIIRQTTEGESAIMQDKRFGVIHFDFDTIIEELDAACIITGIPYFEIS